MAQEVMPVLPRACPDARVDISAADQAAPTVSIMPVVLSRGCTDPVVPKKAKSTLALASLTKASPAVRRWIGVSSPRHTVIMDRRITDTI
jgi:hypothetical protein